MTVSELIEILEEQDPSAEVQLMTQSNWPMRNTVKKLWVDESNPQDNDFSGVVFIVEGNQLGYGCKNAW